MSLSDDQPHTRTRLPVGEQPVLPSGRRPRPLRTLLTVLGVAALLVAAIALANRGKPVPSHTAGAGGGATPGAAAPTAPTGRRPVGDTADGIAVHYPHTRQGAESAAANYAVALGSADMFRASTRHAILATISDPAAAHSLETGSDAAYDAQAKQYGLGPDGSAPAGLTFVMRTIPVGTRTTAYQPGQATVEVWCNGLQGLAGTGSTRPVSESWFTGILRLHWAGGDWKVAAYDQKRGPAPVSGADPASGAREITDAVQQFGGFRYAR